MILDHKLQRMLNYSKIAQLNSERPLHQTAVALENKKWDRKMSAFIDWLFVTSGVELRLMTRPPFLKLITVETNPNIDNSM